MEKQFMLYGYSSPTDGVWRMESKPVTFHYSSGQDFRTKERYEEYKNAGFNTLMLQGNDPYCGEPYETSQLKKNMDNAYAAGIEKIIVFDKRIFDYSVMAGGIIGEDKPFKDEKMLDYFILHCIKDYRNHPAFFGFMLVDEPRWFQMKAIDQIMASTRRVAPEVFIQCNLLPLYHTSGPLYLEHGVRDSRDIEQFKEYIENYLDNSGSPYLLYDSYPMRCDDEDGYSILKWHLPGLQVSADVLKERNKEFYFVCQGCAYYDNNRLRFRNCNDAEMRWQINCILPFGIKSVSYYTYWTKQQNGDSIHVDTTSFICRDGRKGQLYDIMQKVHAEMQVIAPYLLDCKYDNCTYYTNFNEAPRMVALMEKRDLSDIVELSASENAVIVINKMYHTPTGDTIVCLFNANDPRGEYPAPTQVEPKFNGKVKKTFSLKYPNGIDFSNGEITLEPGESMFFVIEKR